jgi:hypothetical protein
VVALATAACDLLPLPVTGWKVDVANANEPLLVTITTDRAAWAWLVPRGGRLVLLNEREPLAGTIELIGVDAGCIVYDSADLLATSFTIVPEPAANGQPDFTLRLEPGAPLDGPVSTDYFGGCSG